MKRFGMNGEILSKTNPKVLSTLQSKMLKALAEMPDANIDLSDAPEQFNWAKSKRGLFRKLGHIS
jgi:hypothetical protein